MSNEAIKIPAAARTEFGKGASRRARVAGLVPAVVYASGFEPIHVTVNRIEFTKIVRNHGVNTVVELDVDGDTQLAMIKSVDQNVLTWEIDHADLLAIKKGERVEVEVPVLVEGESAAGTMMMQETDTVKVEADVMNIPEEIVVNVDGLELGTQITAGDIKLPEGITLVDDAELLFVNIVAPEDNEAEADEAAADVAEAGGESAPAEEAPEATEEAAE